MAELRNVEIFRTGTWTDSSGKTKDFTLLDLEVIRDSYDPEVEEAPAVLGHPEGDAPSYGWAHNLRVVKDRLVADFLQAPREFVAAVKAGRFKKRSISLSPSLKLRHVAFLGAALPAVKGLRDVAFSSGADALEYTFSESGAGPESMEEETMKTELEKLKAEMAQMRTDLTTIKDNAQASAFSARLEGMERQAEAVGREADAKVKAAEDALAKAEKELANFQEAQIKAAREARFDTLVKDGKALPADKSEIMAFAEGLAASDGDMEFSQGDGKTEKVSMEEAFWRRLEAQGGHGLFSEYSGPAPGQEQDIINGSDLTDRV